MNTNPNDPKTLAHLALGDLADLRHHLEQAERFREAAMERLQALSFTPEGQSELEKVRQSPIYKQLVQENDTSH